MAASAAIGIVRRLRELVSDDSGQDVIEYALLSALIGVVGLLTMNTLGVTMGTVYAGWTSAVNALWESPPH